MERKEFVLDTVWCDPKTWDLRSERMDCKPFSDTSSGFSGIVAPTSNFYEDHYIEAFITGVLLSLGSQVSNSVWVLGGDGRHYCLDAFKRIMAVMAGYTVAKVIVPKDGILVTPALSLLVTKYKATGGIYLTASYFSGGPEGKFGIKYYNNEGAAATDQEMGPIWSICRSLKAYRHTRDVNFPVDNLTSYGFKIDGKLMMVEILNAVKIYSDYLKGLFDYTKIRKLLVGDTIIARQFNIIIDCMNGGAGPFVEEVFEVELGVNSTSIINKVSKPAFQACEIGNNTSKDLMFKMKSGLQDAGFAVSAEADRMMFLGRKAYAVAPGDLLALIASHLHCIPYFQLHGIKGLARTLPCSTAIDRVAIEKGIELYEVPPGWTFFARLIRKGILSFGGDSLGVLGSGHLQEKDAIWGILATLSVLYHMKMPVKECLKYHWNKYGKSFNMRMDFEGIDESSCYALLDAMEALVTDPKFFGSQHGSPPHVFTVYNAENYMFFDPTDAELTQKSGVKISFEGGARIVCRKSETDRQLFRLYLESYTTDPDQFDNSAMIMLQPLVKIALKLLNIDHFFGNVKPKETYYS